VLLWIYSTLTGFENQEQALEETKLLQTYFSKLPKSAPNYGLVHYDFELDNVFYDKGTCTCNVIDFDDAMYHWYAMDIEQALDSIKDEIESSRYEQVKECFLNGYRSEYAVTDEMLSLLPMFRRFANLYGYARVLRSSGEKWNNEPKWLEDLRVKLNNSMKNRSRNFGSSL
jgi:Ser/Thr protein kinase RdoA (MazF antagonist)